MLAVSLFECGYRVIAPTMKRLALEKTSDRQESSPPGAVRPYGPLGVDAAARPETAVPTQERRERHPVGVNQQEQNARGQPWPRAPVGAVGRRAHG